VNQENETAIEPKNQILAAPLERGDALTRQLGSHLCRIVGACQPRIEDLDRLEPAADDMGVEAKADRFDFGQLRHPLSLAPSLPTADSSDASSQAIITPRMTL
jgi:hypothetical protein